MFIFTVLVLAALIAGVVWLVRTLSDGGRSGASTALETLELRYARGEIDRDEYLQRRDDLERRT
ncbi:MAG: SHOCT domain-containing protein [Actinomycetota bacterium]|nr:SHOCT domain-containing protein [Actinomycetota bacterium]